MSKHPRILGIGESLCRLFDKVFLVALVRMVEAQ